MIFDIVLNVLHFTENLNAKRIFNGSTSSISLNWRRLASCIFKLLQEAYGERT